MIKAILVAESRLDRGPFLLAARQVTGEDHAKGVDASPLRSVQAEDIAILDSFAEARIGDAVTYLGFMFVGLCSAVDPLVDRLSGMPHVTALTSNPMAKAVVATGSVFHWVNLTVQGCAQGQPEHIRKAFTDVYRVLDRKGLQEGFSGLRRSDQRDGTVLLLPRN